MKIHRFPKNSNPEVMLGIAENYAAAIARRGREATCPHFLSEVWAEHGAYFVRRGQNFLVLYKVGEMFLASHFAPETIRGGYRLIRAIREAGLPICFAVPEDLAVDLARMGWVRMPAFASLLLAGAGMPSGKEVLLPRHMLKTAWAAFKARGDVWKGRDISPAFRTSRWEADRLLGLHDRQRDHNRAVAAEWQKATALGNVWPTS